MRAGCAGVPCLTPHKVPQTIQVRQVGPTRTKHRQTPKKNKDTSSPVRVVAKLFGLAFATNQAVVLLQPACLAGRESNTVAGSEHHKGKGQNVQRYLPLIRSVDGWPICPNSTVSVPRPNQWQREKESNRENEEYPDYNIQVHLTAHVSKFQGIYPPLFPRVIMWQFLL